MAQDHLPWPTRTASLPSRRRSYCHRWCRGAGGAWAGGVGAVRAEQLGGLRGGGVGVPHRAGRLPRRGGVGRRKASCRLNIGKREVSALEQKGFLAWLPPEHRQSKRRSSGPAGWLPLPNRCRARRALVRGQLAGTCTSPARGLLPSCDAYDVAVRVQISSSAAPRFVTRRMQDRYSGLFRVAVEMVQVVYKETNLCVSGSGAIRRPVLEKEQNGGRNPLSMTARRAVRLSTDRRQVDCLPRAECRRCPCKRPWISQGPKC